MSAANRLLVSRLFAGSVLLAIVCVGAGVTASSAHDSESTPQGADRVRIWVGKPPKADR